jgi:hypothetical protein
VLYVLINNDYQLRAVRRHGVAALGGAAGATLIVVPHALSPDLDASDFRAVHRFETPLGRSPLPKTLWRYVTLAGAIARTFHPGPGDSLLFFTEVEWLNQIIARHFHRRGARVVLLEDGGFATYLPMSVDSSEPLTVRERFIQAVYRLVPGLRRSRMFKVNGQVFPRLPDETIDAIAVYLNVSLRRPVPTCRVRKPAPKTCDIRRGTVLFLNEPMYDTYQTGDRYFAGLRRLLTMLTKGFGTVHFKFHPRETEEWRARIRELLTREFPAIDIIDRHGLVEDMIQNYRPEALASYFSAALLNIEYEGIEPLYLYHLLEDVAGQPVAVIASHFLRTLGYRFAASDGDVCSGYCSGINAADPATAVELRQLLSASSDNITVGRPRIVQKLPA